MSPGPYAGLTGIPRDPATGALLIAGAGPELQYVEVVSTIPTVSGSSTYFDAVGWAITVTPGARPIVVEAWCGLSPTTDTAGGGAKYRIVRTDTSVAVAQADVNNPVAGGTLPLPPIRRRLSLPAGVPITFKVQIAGRTSGIASFFASPDEPLAIQVREV